MKGSVQDRAKVLKEADERSQNNGLHHTAFFIRHGSPIMSDGLLTQG